MPHFFLGFCINNSYWRVNCKEKLSQWEEKKKSTVQKKFTFICPLCFSLVNHFMLCCVFFIPFVFICVCLCVLCSSSGYTKLDVDGSDQTTPVMPINPASDPAPTTKRQAKRRIRRRRETTGSVGCAKECVGQARHSRSHKQVHTHSGSSSEDEQRCREARSWSREKARRRRSSSRHTQTHPREERGDIELMSVNSDEGQKENQPPLCKDPDTSVHKKLSKREERGGQSQAANHRKGSEHGSSRSGSEEEKELITKTYEERDSGDPNMSVPSPCKCTNPTNQNGATPQASTDDEQEVCRWERGRESCTLSENYCLDQYNQRPSMYTLQQGFSREWQKETSKLINLIKLIKNVIKIKSS